MVCPYESSIQHGDRAPWLHHPLCARIPKATNGVSLREVRQGEGGSVEAPP